MERDVWLMLIGIAVSIPIAVGISWIFYWFNNRATKDWVYKILIAYQNGESLVIPRDSKGRWTGGIGVNIKADTARGFGQAHPPDLSTDPSQPIK